MHLLIICCHCINGNSGTVKRKKEYIFIKGKENEENEFGCIIRKEKKFVEIEIWKEDQENTYKEFSQQEIYKEVYKLKKDS